MNALQPETITGLFTLGGVTTGALLTPFTQLALEWVRERNAASRAKLLIAGEIMQNLLVLGGSHKGKYWPAIENVEAVLKTSSWHKNKAILIGKIDEDLWTKLDSAYTMLEFDKQRIIFANKSKNPILLPAKEAKGIKELYFELGHLRRKLGGGGGFRDEVKDELEKEIEKTNFLNKIKNELKKKYTSGL